MHWRQQGGGHCILLKYFAKKLLLTRIWKLKRASTGIAHSFASTTYVKWQRKCITLLSLSLEFFLIKSLSLEFNLGLVFQYIKFDTIRTHVYFLPQVESNALDPIWYRHVYFWSLVKSSILEPTLFNTWIRFEFSTLVDYLNLRLAFSKDKPIFHLKIHIILEDGYQSFFILAYVIFWTFWL